MNSLSDISKITLENIDEYMPNRKSKKRQDIEKRRKEYQRKYFQNVTKEKRRKKKLEEILSMIEEGNK